MISKYQFLRWFGIIVIILALIRCIFPSIAEPRDNDQADAQPEEVDKKASHHKEDTLSVVAPQQEKKMITPVANSEENFGLLKKHPIMGVYNYSLTFPDSNDVQLETAKRLGVTAVADRKEAEERKSELVYVAASPYYHVDKLKRSIPYLVPKAAVLLNDIGRSFYDSLYVKGIPLHQFVVTSVLRSQEDLEMLKQVNRNVSENSCHLLGTTFDIGYNRYKVVDDPDHPFAREVGNDTLKWVISEVLRDLRENGRCYVKYEIKQGCFHITVR
jgi:hypothetical protein